MPKTKVIRNVASAAVVVVLVLVGSFYMTNNLAIQNAAPAQSSTSNSQTSFLLSDTITYSTQTSQPPAGAQVQQISEDAYWPYVYDVKNNSQFLVLGTVYGIWNTTAKDIGANVIGVDTFFVVHVNQSLAGNIKPGQLIMVMQQGGLSFPSNTVNQYLNETFDNYPLLKIHSSYVLALSQVFSSALVLYGPYSEYPVRNGVVYSVLPSPGLNNVSLTDFVSAWNAIGHSSGGCCSVVTTSTTGT